MEEKLVNSHIQMPKAVLKRFEKDHLICYYDVSKAFIGTKGHAKSINTELGYYSAETEEFFGCNIETPLGKLLKAVDRFDLCKFGFSINSEFDIHIKTYAYSLIGRSPRIKLELDCLPEQIQRDFTAVVSTFYNEIEDAFSQYTTTLVINKSAKKFVLPTLGMYYKNMWGYDHLVLPITPDVAVILVPPEAKDKVFHDGFLSVYKIESEKDMLEFNCVAFNTQIKQGHGYVVAQEKQTLLELCEICCG